jgi:hypothetical protein
MFNDVLNDDFKSWVASSNSPYGGSLNLRINFAVIIAVNDNDIEGVASNVLVSTMLHDINTMGSYEMRVISARPEGSVPFVENELIRNNDVGNNSSSFTYRMMRMKPHAMIFDSLFPYGESTFDGEFYPSQFGYKVFYIVPASGDNEEELRDSAIKGYLDLTKNKDLRFIDRVIVNQVNDLDALEAFSFTEFLFE